MIYSIMISFIFVIVLHLNHIIEFIIKNRAINNIKMNKYL